MGSHTNIMKVLLFSCLLSLSCARPRYLVIDLDSMSESQSQPVLARQARMAQQQDMGYQPYTNARMDVEGAASNAYSAPAPAGPDHVDYGAYTGGYGAFG